MTESQSGRVSVTVAAAGTVVQRVCPALLFELRCDARAMGNERAAAIAAVGIKWSVGSGGWLRPSQRLKRSRRTFLCATKRNTMAVAPRRAAVGYAASAGCESLRNNFDTAVGALQLAWMDDRSASVGSFETQIFS